MKRWLGILLLAVGLGAGPGQARAEPIVALTTTNQLFTFDSSTPGSISTPVTVTGLTAGEALVGIDARPVDGALVGVGFNSTTGMGSVYTLNIATGAATSINTGLNFGTGAAAWGVDFNPVSNALRIVNNNLSGGPTPTDPPNNNFRITAGGAGGFNVDGDFNPSPSNIVGAAYSNNVPGGVGGQTTLYGIDATSDQLLTQGSVNFPGGATPVSPNTGTLSGVGALGVNTNNLVGFDISDTGAAFASLTPGSGSNFYTIDLATGQATLVGAIGNGTLQVQGLTVAIPEPASLILLALGAVGMGGYVWRRRQGQRPEV